MDKEEPIKCQNCGSDQVFEKEGGKVCYDCGAIHQDSNLISATQFNADGQALGTYVGRNNNRAYGSGGRNVQRTSREVTKKNGSSQIDRIAPLVDIEPKSIVTQRAFRLFEFAMRENMIQGRRTAHICAVCLYVACRLEKEDSHLLIDFSDALKVNVFVLGNLYMKMKEHEQFPMDIPMADPSMYISRFAQGMEFGEETKKVVKTAVSVVKRMSRDWIVVGRQPMGVCAAALFIAARLHGFKRTQKDILQVVKITPTTLKERVEEFAKTEASKLGLAQFERIAKSTNDFEADEKSFRPKQADRLQIPDPPSYTRNRVKEQQELLVLEDVKKSTKLLKNREKGSNKEAVGDEDDEDEDVFAKMRAELEVEFSKDLHLAIEDGVVAAAEDDERKKKNKKKKSEKPTEDAAPEKEQTGKRKNRKRTSAKRGGDDSVEREEEPPLSAAVAPSSTSLVNVSTDKNEEDEKESDDDSDNDDDDVMEEYMKSLIRSDQQVQYVKSKWEKDNGDWEKKQKEKREEMSRTGKVPTRRKRKRVDESAGAPPDEAAGGTEKKEISTAVNYAALDSFLAGSDQEDESSDDDE